MVCLKWTTYTFEDRQQVRQERLISFINLQRKTLPFVLHTQWKKITVFFQITFYIFAWTLTTKEEKSTLLCWYKQIRERSSDMLLIVIINIPNSERLVFQCRYFGDDHDINHDVQCLLQSCPKLRKIHISNGSQDDNRSVVATSDNSDNSRLKRQLNGRAIELNML